MPNDKMRQPKPQNDGASTSGRTAEQPASFAALSRENEALLAAEEAYLREVTAFIEKRSAFLAQAEARTEQELIDLKASAWEEHLELKAVDTVGQIDSALVQDELARGERARQDYKDEYRLLRRMRKKPYFGHITFRFDDQDEGEAEEIYVGLRDIIDLENFRQYVIDWRAPLAAVYYQVNELGPATYKNGDYTVTGELLAKYQIEIENGRILRVINSTEQIFDDILQLVLSGPASPHMKAIAQTLQHEQSKIIRTELNRNLLIQGVAGSGKTSIALHRAAYMMYVDKSIKADNILLVTPSESFAAYVSQVLPSLDEENVRSLTPEQIQRYELADVEERFYKYGFAKATRRKIQRLSSYDWLRYAEEFLDFTEREVFQPKEIKTTYLTVPAELLERLYKQNYRYLPPFKRPEAIMNHLRDLIKSEGDFRLVYNQLDEALKDMFLLKDLRQTYQVFVRFVVEEKGEDPALFREMLDEADLEMLALLKVLLYGPGKNRWVRHLIVDEMQDLSFVAHETLRRIYRCPRTLLGDVNQAVHFDLPAGYLDQLAELYSRDQIKLERYELLTSYRSTKQITEFSRGILQDASILPLERPGEPVRLACFDPGPAGQEALFEAAYQQLLTWRAKGCRTAAYITADEPAAKAFRAWLETRNAAAVKDGEEALLYNDFLREEDGFAVTVTDTAQAKGVEFDAVLIPDAGADVYRTALDRTRLYVACTRALHFLTLFAVGEFSPFIQKPFEERAVK